MQLMDVTKRSIGINFSEGKATINVWAPLAEKVAVVVNDETIPLEKSQYGYWQTTTDKIKEATKYKIQIDNKNPLPDPTSVSQPEGVHNASEAIDVTERASRHWRAGGRRI